MKAGAQPRLGRQVFLFVVIVAAVIILVAAITGDRGYMDVRRQRANLEKIRAEVASLRRENAALLEEVRALRKDPYLMEALAREKLGYAKPGEVIFKFRSQNPPVKDVPPPKPPEG